jgi:hypothetical protein
MAKSKLAELGNALFGKGKKNKAVKNKPNTKTKPPRAVKRKQRESDMDKMLEGMSKTERKKFLESMGFQNKEMGRSYYKKGGDVVSKKRGGKVSKANKKGGAPHNRLY